MRASRQAAFLLATLYPGGRPGEARPTPPGVTRSVEAALPATPGACERARATRRAAKERLQQGHLDRGLRLIAAANARTYGFGSGPADQQQLSLKRSRRAQESRPVSPAQPSDEGPCSRQWSRLDV
jgi:hypothetical protein